MGPCINNSSTFPIRHVLLWGASSSLLTHPLTSTYWAPFVCFSLETCLAYAHEALGIMLDTRAMKVIRHSLCSCQESKKEAKTSTRVWTKSSAVSMDVPEDELLLIRWHWKHLNVPEKTVQIIQITNIRELQLCPGHSEDYRYNNKDSFCSYPHICTY